MKQLLFVGDSVTDCGRDRSDLHDLGPGYPKFVAQILKKSGFESTEFINKGVSGDRTISLLKRYDADFKPFDPDVITILIGINDTWRRYDSSDPTTAEKFYDNYKELMTRFKKDFPKAKLIILEPFLLCTDPKKGEWRVDLDPKIGYCRKLARESADGFVPLDGQLVSIVVAGTPDAALSADGVHPTELGHKMIAEKVAEEILRAVAK